MLYDPILNLNYFLGLRPKHQVVVADVRVLLRVVWTILLQRVLEGQIIRLDIAQTQAKLVNEIASPPVTHPYNYDKNATKNNRKRSAQITNTFRRHRSGLQSSVTFAFGPGSARCVLVKRQQLELAIARFATFMYFENYSFEDISILNAKSCLKNLKKKHKSPPFI